MRPCATRRSSRQPPVRGPCSIYVLAKAAVRNYSNVHTDVSRLEELGLIERSDENTISVPYDAVEILLPLAREA